MKLRTLTNLSALVLVALLTLRVTRTQAGEPGTSRTASAKKVQAPTSGHPEKPTKPNAHAAPQAPVDAGASEAANDAGVGPASDNTANQTKSEHTPPPPTIVAVPPPSVAQPRNHDVAQRNSLELPLVERLLDDPVLSASALLLSLLTAAGVALAACALRRCRALGERLANELHITHTRLEQLAQRLIELERLAPALPDAAAPALVAEPAVAAQTKDRAPPRATSVRLGAAGQAELPLLQGLIAALDSHGSDNAAGTHIEVDLQHIEVPPGSSAALTELTAQLSQLNFVAATSPVKPLKEQNFLSIIAKRSGTDNVPRRVVRVHKDAVPELRLLAFGRD